MFVRSTCMIATCRGSIIVFKPNRTCKQWFLGIVSGLFYQMRVKKSSDPEDVLQIRGKVPLGGSVSSNTRNEADGCVQCCRKGPDKFDLSELSFSRGFNTSFNDLPPLRPILRPIHSGFDDLFCNLNRSKKQRQNRDRLLPYLDDLALSWMQPPKKVPKKDQLALNIIVEVQDGNPLTPSDAKLVPASYKKLLNFGSVTSAEDLSNPLQLFHQ
eukprot:scaffold10478_cov38-Cyclotella_meneghiniana.AAC.1